MVCLIWVCTFQVGYIYIYIWFHITKLSCLQHSQLHFDSLVVTTIQEWQIQTQWKIVKKRLKKKLHCKERFENNRWHAQSNIMHQATKVQKILKIFENFWEQRMKEVGDVQNLTLCNNEKEACRD
jgi:hypothetical protein